MHMWDRLSKKGKDCRKNHSVRDRGGNVLSIAETGENRSFVQEAMDHACCEKRAVGGTRMAISAGVASTSTDSAGRQRQRGVFAAGVVATWLIRRRVGADKIPVDFDS